jgi:HAD superfamily hydrolase (TIGR01509 family)
VFKTQLGILWDMDGVLVDSEPLHTAKLIATANAHGVALQEGDFHTKYAFQVPDAQGNLQPKTMALYGAGDVNIYYWLLGQKPELAATYSKEQWLQELLSYYIEHRQIVHPREGIEAVIEHFAKEQALQAIVTVGVPGQVIANTSVLGDVAAHMRFVLTAEDVKQSKPHPEGYLIGIDRLRTELPADTTWFFTAVEDSPNGVNAALAAGIACVQFLLPGCAPHQVAEIYRDKFKVISSAHELIDAIRALQNQA